MKKRRPLLKRVLYLVLKFAAGLIMLIVIAAVLVITNLKSIALEIARSRFPDLIISIDEIDYDFPCTLVVRGVYLQHVDDVTASSAVRIPYASARFRYLTSGRMSIEELTLRDYSMTVDKSRADSLVPFLVLKDMMAATNDEDRKSGIKLNEARIKSCAITFTGPDYDLTMKVDVTVSRPDRPGGEYGVTGTLRDFVLIAHDISTRPLRFEIKTALPDLDFKWPLLIDDIVFSVNGIPAAAKATLDIVDSVFKVEIDGRIPRSNLKELLDLIDYELPIVNDFDINAPVEVAVNFIYDPFLEAFIIVTGMAEITGGGAVSEDHDIELSGLEARLPFEYRIGITRSHWRLGGTASDSGGGWIGWRHAVYGDHRVSDFRTDFMVSGTNTSLGVEEVALDASNCYLDVAGQDYDLKAKLSLASKKDVRESGKYEIEGTLEDFLFSSSDLNTKPLSIEFDAALSYDSGRDDFLLVSGRTEVASGDAVSSSGKLEVKALEADIPFEYRRSADSSSFSLGGAPGGEGGRITADTIRYGRFDISDFRTDFFYDGSDIAMEHFAFKGYSGTFKGSLHAKKKGDEFETDVLVKVAGLDMSEFLGAFKQKRFDVKGHASGSVGLELEGSRIRKIAVRMDTENGIFSAEDFEKSIADLPGGEAVTEELKKRLEKPEYWDALVEALKNYPYEKGKANISWDPSENGTLTLDLFFKGKRPEEKVRVIFPTVSIKVPYHGINSVGDLFHIDEILRKLKPDN